MIRMTPGVENSVQVFLSRAQRLQVLSAIDSINAHMRRTVIDIDPLRNSPDNVWSAPMTPHFARHIGYALSGYGIDHLAEQFLSAANLIHDDNALQMRSFRIREKTWRVSQALSAVLGAEHSETLRTLLDMGLNIGLEQVRLNGEMIR